MCTDLAETPRPSDRLWFKGAGQESRGDEECFELFLIYRFQDRKRELYSNFVMRNGENGFYPRSPFALSGRLSSQLRIEPELQT